MEPTDIIGWLCCWHNSAWFSLGGGLWFVSWHCIMTWLTEWCVDGVRVKVVYEKSRLCLVHTLGRNPMDQSWWQDRMFASFETKHETSILSTIRLRTALLLPNICFSYCQLREPSNWKRKPLKTNLSHTTHARLTHCQKRASPGTACGCQTSTGCIILSFQFNFLLTHAYFCTFYYFWWNF